MNQRFISLTTLTAALAFVTQTPAHAQLFSFAPPDPIQISSTAPSQITLSSAVVPALASVDQVTVEISHFWLGDLIVQLVPPSGPAFTLFDRVGVTPANPDGSSAILGTFVPSGTPPVFNLMPQTYQFAQVGADFAAAADTAVNTTQLGIVSPTPIYAAQTWLSGPFQAGIWQLVITDAAESAGGQFNGAQVFGTPVPEPRDTALAGAFLLLGVVLVKGVHRTKYFAKYFA